MCTYSKEKTTKTNITYYKNIIYTKTYAIKKKL